MPTMPVQRATGHRLRSGTYTNPTVNLTSSYALSNTSYFTLQSDQFDLDLFAWVVDGWKSAPPKRARIAVFADRSRDGDGDYFFQWCFSYMTFGMLNFMFNTFLSGGVESAPVTVMTYTAVDVAVYLQATLYRPQLPGDGEPTFGGWRDVVWRFDGGTIIT